MIIYKEGDVLDSNADVIVNQVNCRGAFGRGIAGQIREKYPEVYVNYKDMCDRHDNKASNLLGTFTYTIVSNGRQMIAGLFSQDTYKEKGVRHTNYKAFRAALHLLFDYIRLHTNGTKKIIVAFPYRIACGLASGDWDIILEIITELSNRFSSIIECQIWRRPND